MFIKKYKYYGNENGYPLYGYVKRSMITNIFTGLAKKDVFEVRALMQGDTNAQIIFYGSKEACLNYMAKFAEFADCDQEGILPDPEADKAGSASAEEK